MREFAWFRGIRELKNRLFSQKIPPYSISVRRIPDFNSAVNILWKKPFPFAAFTVLPKNWLNGLRLIYCLWRIFP
jgi:hypothetical protein